MKTKLLLLGVALNLWGQGTLLTNASVSITFLHQQASAASHPGASAANGIHRAARLGVPPSELPVVDSTATLFVSQEKALAQEARQYHAGIRASNQTPDILKVKSFTARREALATAAMANLQRTISAAGFAGLQRYLATDLRASMIVQNAK